MVHSPGAPLARPLPLPHPGVRLPSTSVDTGATSGATFAVGESAFDRMVELGAACADGGERNRERETERERNRERERDVDKVRAGKRQGEREREIGNGESKGEGISRMVEGKAPKLP